MKRKIQSIVIAMALLVTGIPTQALSVSAEDLIVEESDETAYTRDTEKETDVEASTETSDSVLVVESAEIVDEGAISEKNSERSEDELETETVSALAYGSEAETDFEVSASNSETTTNETESEVLSTDPETDEPSAVATIMYNGNCTETMTWTLDSSGTLTISGTGDMYDYGSYVYGYGQVDLFYEVKDYVKTVVIESGVTSIGANAFKDYSIKSITIADTVTQIGNYAFCNCDNLRSITIPNSVKTIGIGTFSDCDYLSSITIPDNVTSLGAAVFSECNKLITVTIGNGVNSVPAGCCNNCSSLTNVSLGSGVISIGNKAFFQCTNLSSITIPNSVTSINDSVFYKCENLTNIKIPDSVTYIGENTFYGCSKLKTVTLSKNITEISYGLFNGCTSLKAITIPEKTTLICSYAFSNCTSLKTVEFSDLVKTIRAYAFWNCSKLESITLPSYLTTIESQAFFKCTKLKTLYIGSFVSRIDIYAFGYCSSLTDVYYSGDKTDWAAIDISTTGGSSEFSNTYLLNATMHYNATSIPMSSSTVTLGTGSISSLTNTSKGIQIKWKEVSNASGYYVYRKTSSGSYSKIKTIKNASTVSYTDTSVKSDNGTTYTYKVVPYSGGTKGSGSGKTIVRLTATNLSSVNNSSSKKVTVKWSKKSGVTGYQIQYSTSSSFANGNKTKKVSGASTKSCKISGLTIGKTYYVRIRTYKTVNGKTYYSAWSSKQSVKITK